jgi:cation-transporting ATPase E
MYSTLLAILFLFINMNYPFQPIQLSLNSVVAIGIPSFILALEPNNNRIQGNFIINVIRKSIPAALTIVINVISVMIFSSVFKLSADYISTMAIFLLAFTGFQLLFRICYPFNHIRGILFGALIGIFLGGTIGLKSLFDLVTLTPFMFLFVALLCLLDIPLFNLLSELCEKKIFKYKERILR